MSCLEELQENYGKNCECPICRSKIQPVIEAQNARLFISSLQVYCSEHKHLRCGWTGILNF